ncbi:MAG: hypothetical protein U0359_00615 [Byssovorax sp.]
MRHARVLPILALTIGAGCSDAPALPSAAPDGTVETAARLTFGLSTYYDASSSGLKACLDADGICVTEVTRGQEDCHSYAGAEITVGGTPIPLREPGGFAMAFDEPGCTYPIFEADSIQDLVAQGSGPVDVTLRIGGQSLSLTIDDLFAHRKLDLQSGALVVGSKAVATLDPRPAVPTDQTLYFLYDDSDLDDAWCFAKNGYHGFDATLAPLPASAWDAEGFSFEVPETMPAGKGTLGVSDGRNENVSPCPFAACIVHVDTDVELAGVQVEKP